MNRKVVSYAVPIAIMVSLLCGAAVGGEYAPYTYGRWTPVDPGQGGDTEYSKFHPIDPNIILIASDACGLALTCDAGQTWSIVNRGIIGGHDGDGDPNVGTYELRYIGWQPHGALAWDPVDPNYVYIYNCYYVHRGRVYPGSPGRIEWETLDKAPQQWGGLTIAFDYNPDPNGEGLAQYFYIANEWGYVAFTDNGGLDFYPVAQIPGTEHSDPNNSWGRRQNPILTVVGPDGDPNDPNTRDKVLIYAAEPNSHLLVFGVHNQNDPCDANNLAADFWQCDDPNDPNVGLDPNHGAANGIALLAWNASPQSRSAVLAADHNVSSTGGIYTRDSAIVGPWKQRSWERFWNQYPGNAVTALTLDPTDPNICYVARSPSSGYYYSDGSGLLRTKHLWASDPCDTTWDSITWEADNTFGHLGGPASIGSGCAVTVSSDPCTVFLAARYELMLTQDGGETWSQVSTDYADANDPNSGYWKNRGFFPIHTGCVVFAPSDPNRLVLGRNDMFGNFLSKDRGKTFRKFLCITYSHFDPAPASLTYETPEVTYTQPIDWFHVPGQDKADPNTDPNFGPAHNFWIGYTQPRIVSGVTHPTDPNRMWFVIYGGGERSSLLLLTTDGGESLTITMPTDAYHPWDPNYGDDPNDANDYPWDKTMVYYPDLAADPNCTTLYMAAGPEGVYRSTDEDPNYELGKVWTLCLDAGDANVVDPADYDPNTFDPNDPNGCQFVEVDVADVDPNIVYCASGRRGSEDGKTGFNKGYVYRSADGGNTWSRAAPLDANSPAAMISRLVIDPEDPNTVYVAVYDYVSNKDVTSDDLGGVWKTIDGGTSWERLFPDTSEGYYTAFCTGLDLDPKDPNDVYWIVREKSKDPNRVPRPGIYVKRGSAEPELLDDPNQDDPNEPNYPLSHVSTCYYWLGFHPTTGDLYVGSSAGAYWWVRSRVLSLEVGYLDETHHYPEYGTLYGTVYVDGEEYDPNQPDYLYDDETEVTLEAVAAEGGEFYAWYGDLPDGVDANDPCIVVRMDTDRQIQALFLQEGLCGEGMGMMMVPTLGVMGIGLFLVRRRYHRRR